MTSEIQFSSASHSWMMYAISHSQSNSEEDAVFSTGDLHLSRLCVF